MVDANTWDEIYDQFSGIENTSLRNRELFPENPSGAVQAFAGRTPQRGRYTGATTLTQYPGKDLYTGQQDPVRMEVIR